MPISIKKLDQFWSKVSKSGPIHPIHGQCWIWTKGTKNGYGHWGRVGYAHRVSWQIHFGEIPKDLCVCHHCDNKVCVNPGHLFLGTDADNSMDMVKKGRQAHGEKQGKAKLTEAEVKLILEFCIKGSRELGQNSLARLFGVSQATISLVVSRKHWKHIVAR